VTKQAYALADAMPTIEDFLQPRLTWYRRLAQTMIRHKRIPTGGLALLAVVLIALAAPLLTSIDPTAP
jgi:hypothetical protein